MGNICDTKLKIDLERLNTLILMWLKAKNNLLLMVSQGAKQSVVPIAVEFRPFLGILDTLTFAYLVTFRKSGP